MSIRITNLCFDANDPLRLARFWATALHWEIADETASEIALVPTDGTAFQILFLPVPEKKVGKNRIHFDVTTASIEDHRASMRRLLELGARHIDIGQPKDSFVLADPEGNEFCLFEPSDSFVSTSSRLGSLTWDGTPAAGYFWSEVFGWPLVWDQDDETAIRAPDGAEQFITWGPPMHEKLAKNRLHLDIAPPKDGDQVAEVDRLAALGATRVDIGQGDVGWVVMADPDGNEFCVLTPR